MLHRPGPELKRLTPRNNDKLLFDGIPWVSRAQDEHDAFAQALRDRDVELLYLTELLVETLESEQARENAIKGAMASLHLGDTLRRYLTEALHDQSPEQLASYLTAGVRNDVHVAHPRERRPVGDDPQEADLLGPCRAASREPVRAPPAGARRPAGARSGRSRTDAARGPVGRARGRHAPLRSAAGRAGRRDRGMADGGAARRPRVRLPERGEPVPGGPDAVATGFPETHVGARESERPPV